MFPPACDLQVNKQILGITVLPNKITPPEARQTFHRPELMRKLTDFVRDPRRIWISSPGGAGKTTLVRAFLASDTRPLVWYQVDSEDRDPANLFYYLARTVPGGEVENKPLPTLTPEYLPNLPAFCRHFFRAYFARFAEGCVLVFDDFQEGPGEPFFGPVLKAAMAELPENSGLMVLSREEPFPSLARERLNRSLAYLNWNDLRLTANETRRFLFWSRDKEPSPHEIDKAYRLTQGWLAGLLLFLAQPGDESPPEQISFAQTDLLFDYFAGEIFDQLRVETREFLLLCGFLPTISVNLAESLTNNADAGEILRGLARGNHFTFCISSKPEAYRLHPLFRHFLRTRAMRDMTPQQLMLARAQAAKLLCFAGQIEPAANLLIDNRAWPDLIELISRHAEDLLRQGRVLTLFAWLEALPGQARTASPWLSYWRGCCLNAVNPAEAKGELTRAFELFETAGESTGSMLAWAMVVYSIVVGWEDHEELDAWIAKFYQLRESHPEYPSPEIEALMVQSICQALVWRQPSHTDLPAWATRLRQLITASGNKNFRILAGADLVLYYTLAGEPVSVRALAAVLDRDLLSKEVPPLQKLIWFATLANSEILALDRSDRFAAIDAGRAIVAESGIQVMNVRLLGVGAASALNGGDLALARQFLEELKTTPAAALDQADLFYLMADLSSLEGDSAKAISLAEMAVSKSEAVGTPFIVGLSLAVLVLALYQTGQTDRAKEALARGFAVSRGMDYLECYFNLLAAFFALENGETDASRSMLRESFGLAARRGFGFHPWRNDIMARLCREALDAEIEVEYIKRLAACHNLGISRPGPSNLTPKETEILVWVKEGKTNWEIAQIQKISERTVKFHIGNILQKLGASTRAHAVSIALEHGLMASD